MAASIWVDYTMGKWNASQDGRHAVLYANSWPKRVRPSCPKGSFTRGTRLLPETLAKHSHYVSASQELADSVIFATELTSLTLEQSNFFKKCNFKACSKEPVLL